MLAEWQATVVRVEAVPVQQAVVATKSYTEVSAQHEFRCQ
jgi:hypothetical protein